MEREKKTIHTKKIEEKKKLIEQIQSYALCNLNRTNFYFSSVIVMAKKNISNKWEKKTTRNLKEQVKQVERNLKRMSFDFELQSQTIEHSMYNNNKNNKICLQDDKQTNKKERESNRKCIWRPTLFQRISSYFLPQAMREAKWTERDGALDRIKHVRKIDLISFFEMKSLHQKSICKLTPNTILWGQILILFMQ